MFTKLILREKSNLGIQGIALSMRRRILRRSSCHLITFDVSMRLCTTYFIRNLRYKDYVICDDKWKVDSSKITTNALHQLWDQILPPTTFAAIFHRLPVLTPVQMSRKSAPYHAARVFYMSLSVSLNLTKTKQIRVYTDNQ
jgi:hypothetical protein